MMAMNENMKRVVEAMEASPEKWGRGRLRDDDGCMCAMGFACDVYDPGGWDWYGYQHQQAEAPVDVCEWVGITRHDMWAVMSFNDKAESVDEVIAYLKREGWKND